MALCTSCRYLGYISVVWEEPEPYRKIVDELRPAVNQHLGE